MIEKLIRVGCLVAGGVIVLVLVVSGMTNRNGESQNVSSAGQGISSAIMIDNIEKAYFEARGMDPVEISNEAEDAIYDIIKNLNLNTIEGFISGINVKDSLPAADYEQIMSIIDTDIQKDDNSEEPH